MNVNRPTILRFLIIFGSTICGLTTVEAYEVSIVHTINNIRSDQDDQHNSPLSSDERGNFYFAFMNSASQIAVGMKRADGTFESANVAPLHTGLDRWHSRPSIAVDTNGYVHLSGPVHNQDFDYLISNEPYSITSGFTRKVPEALGLHVGGGSVGGSPNYDGTNDAISYVRFTQDTARNLWISYRMRVGNLWSSSAGGTQAAALGRYNPDQQRWEMIGGNSNPSYAPSGGASPKADAFLWSAHTSVDYGSYQSHSAKPYIDSRGYFHYSFKHDRAPAPSGGGSQEILYFYSADSGSTWATADGISVNASPICVTGTPSDVMTPNTPSGTNNIGEAYVSVSNGRPVVAWSDALTGHTTHVSIFQNGRWEETDTGVHAHPSKLVIDSNNVWYLVAGRFVFSSTNDGQSWKTYDTGVSEASSGNASIDMPYFRSTNKIRYVAMPYGTTTKTARIVEFVSDEWSAPDSDPDPSAPAAPVASVD